jgi:hypothetical protein
MLVTAGYPEKAIKYLSYIPDEFHDNLAEFLSNRGHYEIASKIPSLTSIFKLNICLKYDIIEEAFIILNEIQKNPPENITTKDIILYYNTLGSKSLKLNKFEICEKCYIIQGKLDKNTYFNLINLYSRCNMIEKLEELYNELDKMENTERLKAFISILLNKNENAIKNLQFSSEYGLSVLLNQKHNIYDQSKLYHNWQQLVQQKYPTISKVDFN